MMERQGRLRIVSCSSLALALAAGIELVAGGSAFAADPPPAASVAQATPAPAASPPPVAPAPATAPASAPPAATASPAAAPAAALPPPPPPPAGTPAPVPAPPPPPPPSQPAAPPADEVKLPPIDVGVWLRAAGRLQGSDPKNLDSAEMDTAYAELHASGKIHKNVSLTLNLNANGLAGTAGIEDAIIGFDFADPVHLWVGQLLVPVDRANFAGPFFMIPWNYPGFITVGATTLVGAPMEGPAGRNTGASIWGNDPDGKIKYAVGVFLPNLATNTPLLSARVSTAIIGKETGYFGNESFFGKQDIVSVGVGAQYKKDGSVGAATPATATTPAVAAPTDNYAEFNADALAEFRYGDGGWVSFDGAYYHFAGQYNPIKDSFYVTAAVATPKVGIGNIQPMVRYQEATGSNIPNISTVDAGVAYLIMGPALRVMVNFQHADIGNGAQGNALQFGAQGILF